MNLAGTSQLAAESDSDVASVIDYLKQHPDFFRHHAYLLADLDLPHLSGDAVSLVERQVSILRERSIETRRKLGELIDAARENDELFRTTQHLVLKLLDCETLDQLIETTRRSLNDDFHVSVASVIYLSDVVPQPTRYCYSLSLARASIGHLLDNSRTLCGSLRDEEKRFLFEGKSIQTGSAAVAGQKLGNRADSPYLVIAIAEPDPLYYNSDTGTLFLDYLCEVASKLTQRLLAT